MEEVMFTRILIPTDFSPPSDAALAHGRVLARSLGASLHVLHVVEDQLVTGPFGAEVYVPNTPGTLTRLLDEARVRLDASLTADDRARLRVSSDVIVGTAARTIVEYAADNGYDLIVMGTHGRSGVAHLLMGSVAEHVVRSAPCAVLTVREAPVPVDVQVVGSRRTATA
jgi:nucleotide-binding universal stress UspA family protein